MNTHTQCTHFRSLQPSHPHTPHPHTPLHTPSHPHAHPHTSLTHSHHPHSSHPLILTQMYGMIHLCHLQDVLTKLEMAVLLTSAASHDLDHPGFNNKLVMYTPHKYKYFIVCAPPPTHTHTHTTHTDTNMLHSYQINARTELAIRYNDISPLENHHCAVAFQILGKVRMSALCTESPVGQINWW